LSHTHSQTLEYHTARIYVSCNAKEILSQGKIMLTDHDRLLQRCPMLGHEVAFSYCRQPGQETPCRKIFDCWWETFDIQTFVGDNYPEEIPNAITQPPKPKMLSLIEIIEQARKNSSAS
jgi:hypothetical protein